MYSENLISKTYDKQLAIGNEFLDENQQRITAMKFIA